jgi:Cytochrome c oxidase subunit IV
VRFPEEVAFFARSAVFALVLAAIYWFVSYEWAGTVLLFLFGLGSAGAALVLGRAAAGQDAPVGGRGDDFVAPDGPFGDESGPIPAPSFAPIVFGVGVAVAALGLAFGPWLLLAAVMPIVLGATSWLGAASAEWRAHSQGERE